MDQTEESVELSHMQNVEGKKETLYQHNEVFGKCLFVKLLQTVTKNSIKRTSRLQMSTVASWVFEQLYYLIKNIFLLYDITEKKTKSF